VLLLSASGVLLTNRNIPADAMVQGDHFIASVDRLA
jgi:hypothetical protein